MTLTYASAGPQHAVQTMGSHEEAVALIRQVQQDETDFENAAGSATTLQILDPEAPWVGLVSPSGLIDVIRRALDASIAGVTIPEYPAAPPIGLTLNRKNRSVRAEIVIPRDALQAAAEFIRRCMTVE